MHTLDDQAAGSGGILSNLRRDLLLLRDLARMLLQYFIQGRRERRTYRRQERSGETYWVDEVGPSTHRDAALTDRR
jgi:hypothetical protein